MTRRSNKAKGIQSPRRRSALRLITLTNQTMASITRMRESWVRGVDLHPGADVRGAGAGTLVQDWDE